MYLGQIGEGREGGREGRRKAGMKVGRQGGMHVQRQAVGVSE